MAALQEKVWQGKIPLRIRLSPVECRTYSDSLSYMISYPRLSYLPFLLPRLRQFFAPALIAPEVLAHEGWFSFDGVPLKWQYPVGLLYDLLSNTPPAQPADEDVLPSRQSSGHGSRNDNSDDGDFEGAQLPWTLVLHFADWPQQLIPLDAEGKHMHDAFINSVKEADFLRNGTAKAIMTLSREDSHRLWSAVQDQDFNVWNGIHRKFLNQPGGGSVRHVPLKVYLPSLEDVRRDALAQNQAQGALRVIQGLVSPLVDGRGDVQTLGTALHALLPSIFPSRKSYIHAQAVLHGAVLPLAAPVDELMQYAAYCDGFLHVAVAMVGLDSSV